MNEKIEYVRRVNPRKKIPKQKQDKTLSCLYYIFTIDLSDKTIAVMSLAEYNEQVPMTELMSLKLYASQKNLLVW